MKIIVLAFFAILLSSMAVPAERFRTSPVAVAGEITGKNSRLAVEKDDAIPQKNHFLISVDGVCGAHCPDCTQPTCTISEMPLKSAAVVSANLPTPWPSPIGRVERPPCV